MIKLDLKDKRLLSEIDFNARKSYSELAKSLRMSKRGVEYKLENLTNKKIILGYSPIINIQRLGYLYCRIFVKFRDLTKEIEKEIEDYIKNDKDIGWSIKYYGLFDNGFTIWAKDITEFKEIANRFYLKFDKYIKTRIESIATEVIFYKNRYLLKNKSLENIKLIEKEDIIILDSLDKNILLGLIKKPRITLVDLAINLKESPKKIAYRINNLIKNKVLLGIRPIINHELLGYTYYKIFFNLTNSNVNKIKELESYVSSNPKTIYIIKAIGTCDFDVEIMVESNKEMIDFIEDLQNKFPGLIKEYNSMILTKTIKINYLP